MNIQQICVLDHLLRVLESDDLLNGQLIPPEVMTTEEDYSELWLGECKCECEWSNEKSQKHRRGRAKFSVSEFFYLFECFFDSKISLLRAIFHSCLTKTMRS